MMRGGKAEYYRVPDKDLLLALTSFRSSQPGSWYRRSSSSKPANGRVTSSPEFMARNFVRDSLSSWVISDDKFADWLGFRKG